MEKSLFITFEGIEGCGKTTQLSLAARWLETHGRNIRITREPGGTEIGSRIRKILLSETTQGLMPISEALLYMADRFQHIHDVIAPALVRGETVLCDRYHDSTVAYQGYARGISLELLESIRTSGAMLDPDLTFLFDLDPQMGLERSFKKLAAQQIDESRFEKETLEFHQRVREGFLVLLQQNPERMIRIDASKSIDMVHGEITKILEERLKIYHEVK